MHVPEGFLEGEIRSGFYVEREMKKAWAAELEVLHEVDRVCKKHNIQYFADWGTLLGAVRHKGFIPWDDDMDITMKRSDYIKFCKIAPDEMKEYNVVNIHTQSDWDSMVARIVNGKRIRFDEEHLKKFHGCPWVVGLDIFPLDFVAPTKEDDEYHCYLLRIVEAFRQTLENGECDEEAVMKTSMDMEKMLGVKFDEQLPLTEQLLNLRERLSMIYTESESSRVAIMTDHAGARKADVYPKEYYSRSIEMPFEYTTIPVPVEYDAILRQKYGQDYNVPRLGGADHEYPFYMKQKRELYSQLGIKI